MIMRLITGAMVVPGAGRTPVLVRARRLPSPAGSVPLLLGFQRLGVLIRAYARACTRQAQGCQTSAGRRAGLAGEPAAGGVR